MSIERLLELLARHEIRTQRGICLTPSENTLSPLARLPFLLDAYSRYFLDDLRLFGSWCFHAGREPGRIEQELLVPLLRQMSRAAFVNVRPISGLNCMTAAVAAFCEAGDLVLTVPTEVGGHASTAVVARRLGAVVEPLPFRGVYDVDLERLGEVLHARRPTLIYIDQSTMLFPLDPRPLRELVDTYSPDTLIHYDSSHANGLILGGAMFNPLERGADTFGGSTHKTLPGPHKAFLATNDRELASRFQQVTDHFVSHHHTAEVTSLAITLMEMRDCGGSLYARRVLDNARAFARALFGLGAGVAAADRGFTGCHQVWVAPGPEDDLQGVAERLYNCGLMVNNFQSLPGIAHPAFRLSLSEATRLGATEQDAAELAGVLGDVLLGQAPEAAVRGRVAELGSRLDRPRYCYELSQLESLPAAQDLTELLKWLWEGITEPETGTYARAAQGGFMP